MDGHNAEDSHQGNILDRFIGSARMGALRSIPKNLFTWGDVEWDLTIEGILGS